MKDLHEAKLIWRTWGRLFLHAKSEWENIMRYQKACFTTSDKVSNHTTPWAHLCFLFPLFVITLLCGFLTGMFYGEINVQGGIMRAVTELLIYGGAYAILWHALPPIAEHYLPALDRKPIRITLFFVFGFLLLVEIAVRVMHGFNLLYLLDIIAIYWILESIKANDEIYENEYMKALLIMAGGLVLSILTILLLLMICLPRI